MGPLFAAVGAAIAALMEVTVASRIHLADAQPQIVLVIAVLLTLITGFEEGMAWAFVGGLFVDLLAFRPLGSTVFGLLVVVGLASAVSPILARARSASSLVGVALFTPVFIVLSTVTSGLLRPPAPQLHLSNLVAEMLVNVMFGALVAPLFIAIRRRWEQRERLSW
ncbi:MAG: rod shape-determining protein MreD [Candidatus Limnocylindrales bacterium]|jgi:rod shape-determining protein MreD